MTVATVQLAPSRRRPDAVGPPPWDAPPTARSRVPRAASALGLSLLILGGWAAFAHGAIFTGDAGPIEATVALVGVVTAAGVLFGRLRARTTAAGSVALALFAGLTAWSGISLAWSVARDETWISFNRTATYAAVLVLAVVLGSSHPRARERTAGGGLLLALVIALYALGGKVAPGVHIGPIDLDQAAVSARLRAPLEYWNALALVCCSGVLLALRAAVDETRGAVSRLGGLASVAVFLVVLGLTYSRGAVVALVIALVVSIGFGGGRLRSLLALGMAVVACAPALAVAFTRHDLTQVVPLSERTDGGVVLGAVLLGALGALVGAGWAILRLEARTPPDPARSRKVGRLLLACVGVALVTFLGRVALSDGGLGGAVDRAGSTFAHVREKSATDPARLLTLTSANRYSWWQEAWGAGVDRPGGGWGAGSFGVVHLLYRQDELQVRQAHSEPLQLWAELGVVGLVLGVGAMVALGAAAVGGMRQAPVRRERALGAALLGVGAAWAAQDLVDWTWDVPGVTLPALVAVGVLVGSGAPRAVSRRDWSGERGVGGRALALAGVTLGGAAFALSAVLPGLAQHEAATARVAAATAPRRSGDALKRAELAARLDPLGTDGLLAAGAILEREGHLVAARTRLLDAAERSRYDSGVWFALARATLALGDARGYTRALEGLRESDPRGALFLLADPAVALLAPPSASATAMGTPLGP